MQGPVLASAIATGGGQAHHASRRQSRVAGHGSADRAARATDVGWVSLSVVRGEIAAHHRPRSIYARAPGDVARQPPRPALAGIRAAPLKRSTESSPGATRPN